MKETVYDVFADVEYRLPGDPKRKPAELALSGEVQVVLPEQEQEAEAA